MKPRIALFGLPPKSTGQLHIWIFANGDGHYHGDRVYEANNDESGKILAYLRTDIEIGCKVTIVIMSSGICEYSHSLEFKGADISHVPNFRKETNTDEAQVSKDWNIDLWRSWNPQQQHDHGLKWTPLSRQ